MAIFFCNSSNFIIRSTFSTSKQKLISWGLFFSVLKPSHASTVASILLESIILLGVKSLITKQAVVFLGICLEWLYIGLVDVVNNDGGNSDNLEKAVQDTMDRTLPTCPLPVDMTASRIRANMRYVPLVPGKVDVNKSVVNIYENVPSKVCATVGKTRPALISSSDKIGYPYTEF